MYRSNTFGMESEMDNDQETVAMVSNTLGEYDSDHRGVPLGVRTYQPVWHDGRGSMMRMLKVGKQGSHKKFAAKDALVGNTGAKCWASFPGHEDLCAHILSLPPDERCIYELITEESRVRMWFDIEFVSDRQEDGEERRVHLEGVLRQAICTSFDVGMQDIVMFWGTSTRFDTRYSRFKHSYQLRVPSVVFASNQKNGGLARWVHEFIRLTSSDPLMMCPVTNKHIIDPVVYSRTRCVRACFCCKRSDPTHTPLLFMDGVSRYGPQPTNDQERFVALMVEPNVTYGNHTVVSVQDSHPIKCAGVQVGNGLVAESTTLRPYLTETAILRMTDNQDDDREGGAVTGARRDRNAAGLDSDRVGAAQRARMEGGNSCRQRYADAGVLFAGQRDRTVEVVECLALLGPEYCEDYPKWTSVMFAVRNACDGAEGDNIGMCMAGMDAFIEWSKRAATFESDADVRSRFISTERRSAQDPRPRYGLTYLQRNVAADPVIVYTPSRRSVVINSECVTEDHGFEWSDFYRNVDMKKTKWRCITRVARLLWPTKRHDIVADIAVAIRQEDTPGSMQQAEQMVGSVWDLSACSSTAFKATILASIRRELTWPKLVTDTIPKLVGEEMGISLEATEYISDGGNQVQITLLGPPVDEDEDEDRFARSYKLNLHDGVLHGTKVDLWDRGKIMLDRNGLQLLDEMHLRRTVDWADCVVNIPKICENMRRVRPKVWCIFDKQKKIWEEYPETSSFPKRFLKEAVLEYFRPLADFLEYKATFDTTSDAQRAVMMKVFSFFANAAYLDGVLAMMESHPTLCIKQGDYNKIFNANPYVLPCANGLLDFRTLQIRPLEKDDYMTYTVPAVWDPHVCTVSQLDFISSLFPYNTVEVTKFIITWLGYCLTGLTQQQILVFMIGYGSNGKSKLSRVMENILGNDGFAHVPYESLCQKGSAPNEEVFAARNARMWQIDENDGNESLNMSVIKRVSGEDSISCRPLYGHVVEIPPRAKLNFAVNKPPKLPAAKEMVEQFSLIRRFVYIDCAMQFVDLSENSKDQNRVNDLRSRLTADEFAKCVRQVDINLDLKLNAMTPGFLRLFAEAIHKQFRMQVIGDSVTSNGQVVQPTLAFEPIYIPVCIQEQVHRMMKCNAGFDAQEFLYGAYEAGVVGEIPIKDMYEHFLKENDLRSDNYRASRFDDDLKKWMTEQNATNSNCKQSGMHVRAIRAKRGDGQRIRLCQNVALKDNDAV